MTKENWLAIAQIVMSIITIPMMFASAAFAVYVQRWMSQPQVRPVANQPKNFTQSVKDTLFKLGTSSWTHVALIAAFSLEIAWVLPDFDTSPRFAILFTSLCVSFIFLNINAIIRLKTRPQKIRELQQIYDELKLLHDRIDGELADRNTKKKKSQ